ncbi:uncharacterized protein TRAVEDRAFT_52881 [Trametes versicolor FP-101664 SS1]|uniref:uncharacterized protein n=1 Tax=Trametes versicolor (strain FP-101664) TaxID=717944 RepID=UPI000462444E|nr:uncharacterized protein TRAVEDRAFT_52881 [Trametes versicolor FP-101664 SS1]EIW53758.1 hypothetical protein TRAVEDRAFT_52881 [Trametes versicolor FP-101664 SS1]
MADAANAATASGLPAYHGQPPHRATAAGSGPSDASMQTLANLALGYLRLLGCCPTSLSSVKPV